MEPLGVVLLRLQRTLESSKCPVHAKRKQQAMYLLLDAKPCDTDQYEVLDIQLH